jgi:prepilin peptidase CpaA
MGLASSAATLVLVAGVGAAAIVDLRTGRIPNPLTIALAAAGITLAGTGDSGISIGASFLGFAIGLALMLPGHALGATGAGDVKLVAAVGAIVGPVQVVNVFLLTAVAGGVLALAVAIRRGRLTATLAGTGRLVTAPADARRTIAAPQAGNRFCYGPAIAAGSILAAVLM